MRAPPSLPIDAAREAFEAALRGPAPVVVVAPTGSGKSTRLPEWIADAGPGRVLVVQPRRVACRALATWVAQRRGGSLGHEVGYRVRFDDRSGPDTRILFVTPGVALNLLGDEGATAFAAIMVDEFHERSWEIDLVVALCRRARDRGATVKLLLCSATLEAEALVESLGATLVQAQGRRFDVEVEHHGDALPSGRELEPRVTAAVQQTLRDGPPGDVLVFLPGKGEIERCARALAHLPATVCPVHGGLTPEALTRAFAESPGHTTRRVFLATNVAETSLTLPGVTTVIDSGLVRRRQHQAGRSVLALVAVSRASMDQRAGRAGRVAPGRCLRLWTSRFEPEPVTPPEISRVELDDLVLRASQCGLPASQLAEAPWVEPPPAFALRAAIERLTAEGTLDPRGELTAVGRARARLPVSAFSARILVEPPPALAGDVADLVALVETGRDLVLGSSSGGDLELGRRACFGGATDEVTVQLLALRRGQARRDGLHPAALTEARALARSLRAAIGAPAPTPDEPLDREGLVDHLLQRVPEAAFVPRARATEPRGRRRGGDARASATPWGNGAIEVMVRPPWIPGLEADEQPPPPEAGLVLDLEWLGQGRGAEGRGRLLLRCTRRRLHAAGLGDAVVGRPVLAQGELWADVERRYAGVVIHRDREPLRGAALCEGIAALVLEGRLVRGLAEPLLDDLHLWSLVEQQGQGPAQPVPSPAEYLASRLRTAGLDQLSELALLEPDDLRPDVAARALARGLGSRELETLRADFPRRFVFEGNVYDCHVDLGARQVVLEAHTVRGRGGGEPPARVLPRFRGFSVIYRKASRELRLR